MNVLVWLDATLVALGLLAMSPRLWNRFRHRRTVCPPVVGRGMQTATALLFYLGLGGLTMAGVDVGLAMKDAARRSRGSVNDESHYYSAHTRRFPQNAEAPDFRLPLVDEDCSIRLSEFRGHKPVVLIFGSFGWDIFCGQVVRLRQLHEKYGGRAQFLFVYIHEASHELPEALRDFAEPAGAPLSSRRHLLQRIEAGRKHFDLRFPCLLDNEQEEIQQLYRAYPMRLLLVNTAGRVVSDSGRMEFDDSFPWKKITDWFDCRD